MSQAPREVYRRQLVFKKESLAEHPVLGELFSQVMSLLPQVSPPSVLPMQVPLETHLVIRSLSAPLRIGNDKPMAGQTRMENGEMQILKEGPSGQLRWQRQKDEAITDKQNTGKENPGATNADAKEAKEIESVTDKEKKKLDDEFKNVKRKDTEVSISTKDGSSKKIKGVEVSGLVVHISTSDKDTFVISHAKSGAAVAGGYSSEDDALMSAWRASQDLDWSRSAKDVLNDPAFHNSHSYLMDSLTEPYAKKKEAPKGAENKGEVKKSLQSAPSRPVSSSPIGMLREVVLSSLPLHTELTKAELRRAIKETALAHADACGVDLEKVPLIDVITNEVWFA